MKLNQQAPNDPDETGFDQPLQDLVFTALDVELHAADLGNAARREETGYVQHLNCDRLGRAMVCEARGGIRLQHQLVLAVAIADGCFDDFHSAVMLKQIPQEFRLCRKRLEDDRAAAVPAENVATPGSPVSSGVNHEVLGADRKITYQQTVAALAEKIPEGAWKATVPPGPESGQRPFRFFTDPHKRSNDLPCGREKVARVVLFAREPARRDDHDLVRIRVEPGAPPTEGAVGNDVVSAEAHEVKVLKVAPGVIPGHDGHGMVEVQVSRGPFRIVGKNKEVRLWNDFGDATDSSLVIVRAAKPVHPAGVRIGDIVAPAHMQGHRIAAGDPSSHLLVAAAQRMANSKLTPQESFYAREVSLALPIALQVNVVRRFENFGVECESLLQNIAVLAEGDKPVKAARQLLGHPATAPEAPDLVAGRKRLDDVEVTQRVSLNLIRFVVRDIELKRRGAAHREGPAERVLEKLIAQSADQPRDHHTVKPQRKSSGCSGLAAEFSWWFTQ